MSQSLQDQLLALGLANKAAAGKQSRSDHRRATKPKSDSRPPAQSQKRTSSAPANPVSGAEPSLEQAYGLREKHNRELAAQARERKRLEDRRRHELNDRIRVIVAAHRLNDPAAELSRNFIYKGRIRKVNVTVEQLKALNDGTLGVVYLAGGYHILRPEYVDQVRELSPEHVPELTSSLEDDEQFPVPDDLIW